MERNAPKSAQQERKEYRKLREMYTTLQRNQKTTEGRLAEEEGKRKKLEAQLADEESKRRKLETQLLDARKASDGRSVHHRRFMVADDLTWPKGR